MSYLRYLCLLAYSGVQHILTIWLLWQVSCGRQELLARHWHLDSPLVFGGIHVALIFLFSMLCFLFCLSSSCVLCTLCCQFLWIVHSWLPFRFSLTF